MITDHLTHTWQVLRWGAKLGWDLEGNWLPFAGYLLFSLISPIAGVFMVVFMYRVVSGGEINPQYAQFLLPGMVGFLYIRQILTYSGYVVIEDREHYRLLRYTYIVPFPLGIQVLARVLPRYLISTVGAGVVLGLGSTLMNCPLRVQEIDWNGVIVSLLVSMVAIQSIGWMLAALMLLIDRMGWVFAEGISGIMFLVTGAAFPLSVLPYWLKWVGYILPITYWLDIWRISLFGESSLRSLETLNLHQLWLLFGVTTAAWLGAAIGWGKVADRWARQWGRVERETFY